MYLLRQNFGHTARFPLIHLNTDHAHLFLFTMLIKDSMYTPAFSFNHCLDSLLVLLSTTDPLFFLYRLTYHFLLVISAFMCVCTLSSPRLVFFASFIIIIIVPTQVKTVMFGFTAFSQTVHLLMFICCHSISILYLLNKASLLSALSGLLLRCKTCKDSGQFEFDFYKALKAIMPCT